MISCQVALYPLATKDFDQVIIDAVKSIEPYLDNGLIMDIGSMSTVLRGPDDIVWQAVRRLFDEASKNGQQIVLNVQLSNECGCDTGCQKSEAGSQNW